MTVTDRLNRSDLSPSVPKMAWASLGDESLTATEAHTACLLVAVAVAASASTATIKVYGSDGETVLGFLAVARPGRLWFTRTWVCTAYRHDGTEVITAVSGRAPSRRRCKSFTAGLSDGR